MTLAEIDRRRTAAISNQGLMCRQFLDVYGTLIIVLHLDRKTHCKKHMPILKSEISGTLGYNHTHIFAKVISSHNCA